jgi:hypothetical protein
MFVSTVYNLRVVQYVIFNHPDSHKFQEFEDYIYILY